MTTISLQLEKKPDKVKIIIEKGLWQKIPSILQQQNFGEKYIIIADKNTEKLFGRTLRDNLKRVGIKAILVSFSAGEKSKNLHTVEKIVSHMLKAKVTRSDCVIALGGGVTGDLAGFIASIYMRGIKLIHIPTTLLAMVDSSIGGKTGVDLPAGKNLAGTFYQPQAIYIDPNLLNKLPQAEMRNGYAEIIKYGIIIDKKLFRLLEEKHKLVLKRNLSILNTIIVQCCKIKASVIQEDEHENNLRMVLNYGHTLGHALEKLSSYKISHGRAITMGMRAINKICYKESILKEKTVIRINNLFNLYGLTEDVNKLYSQKRDYQKLWKLMQNDKKAQKSKIRFVIIKDIGKTQIHDQITQEQFLDTLCPS